jgi:predicted CXXCH cytochrome family protein
LSFNAALAQKPASESSELAPILSVNDSISPHVLKPLWGGPTSFDPISTGLDPVVTPTTSTSLHHFDLTCESCHDQEVSDGQTELGLKSEVDINVSCTLSGCHEYDPILNHPVDISPAGFVPEGFPLDSFNRITCLTCHDKETSTSENPSKDRPLQVPTGMGFCSSCHSQMSGTSKEQSHWQFSSKAHLGTINPDASAPTMDPVSGLLDPESQNCLSCHEGITATVSGGLGPSQHTGRLDIMSNHPIGMSYSGVTSGNALKYNNLTGNDEHIRLFDGKMGCGSCHSLYSDIKKNLVQDNTGSRLCFECHNM